MKPNEPSQPMLKSTQSYFVTKGAFFPCLALRSASGGRGIFFVGLVGIFCLAFAVICLSGGRGEILLSSWHQPVNVFALFRDGLAQFFVRAGLSRFPGGLLAVFCWRGGDRELFC